MKILVAIPYDSTNSKPSKSFLPAKIIRGIVTTIISYDTQGITVANKIEFARERLVKILIESDYEKILFIDNDIIVEANELLPLIESEHLVAFALYPYRAQWENNGGIPQYPKEISILRQGGLGCCCIHRKVFTIIEPPYFGKRGRRTAWKREDWNFFRNCLRHKIDAYVYPDIRVGHQNRETGVIYNFNQNKTGVIKCHTL